MSERRVDCLGVGEWTIKEDNECCLQMLAFVFISGGEVENKLTNGTE